MRLEFRRFHGWTRRVMEEMGEDREHIEVVLVVVGLWRTDNASRWWRLRLKLIKKQSVNRVKI
jgi:hypothetical protein